MVIHGARLAGIGKLVQVRCITEKTLGDVACSTRLRDPLSSSLLQVSDEKKSTRAFPLESFNPQYVVDYIVSFKEIPVEDA